MNRDAMVFAMANPNPEVSPEDAAQHARVIATGRSDYPNQINNVLCFPGVFRGALDVRARMITENMKMAAAEGIAAIVTDAELREDYIIPSVFNRDVAPAVAESVAREARASGQAAPAVRDGLRGLLAGDAHGDDAHRRAQLIGRLGREAGDDAAALEAQDLAAGRLHGGDALLRRDAGAELHRGTHGGLGGCGRREQRDREEHSDQLLDTRHVAPLPVRFEHVGEFPTFSSERWRSAVGAERFGWTGVYLANEVRQEALRQEAACGSTAPSSSSEQSQRQLAAAHAAR